MAFFTFAGNILPAYVLPGVPAFALLLAQPIAARDSRVVHAGWLIPVVFLMLGPYVLFDRIADRSQRDLIELVHEIGNSSNLHRTSCRGKLYRFRAFVQGVYMG